MPLIGMLLKLKKTCRDTIFTSIFSYYSSPKAIRTVFYCKNMGLSTAPIGDTVNSTVVMQYGLYLRIFTAMSLFKVYAHTSASSKTIQFKFTGTKSNRTVFAEPACYQPRLFEHPLRGLLGFLSLLSQRQLCCSDASHISLIIAFIWLFPQKRRLLF